MFNINKSYNTKNKFLKNIALGSFLFFAGTFSQLEAGLIHTRAGQGDAEAVAELLDNDIASIDEKDDSGNAPLHFAGTPAVIDLLCDRGADPNITNPWGDTPLHIAIRALLETKGYGQQLLQRLLSRIQQLLLRGTNKDQTNRAGHSPVSIVNQAIQTRLFYDGQVTRQISNDAHSAYTEVQKLFSQVRAKSLYDAVMDNDIAEVHWLLQAGADPNGIDKYGYLPLQCAKTMEMIDLLRRNGADINRPNQWGDPTLRTAVSVPHPDLEYIKQLLLRGADKNTKDGRGRTSVEAVQIAIEYGIVFNSRFNSLLIDDEARITYAKVLVLFLLPQNLWPRVNFDN
jgi:ankyrin repeat protein